MWKIKRFIRQIKNVIRWLPTIWKDADWDDFYIFEILRVKLKHQAKYIGDRNFFEGADREAEKMRLCVRLIERIQEDYYESESHSYHETEFIFDESEDGTDTYKVRIEELSEDFDSYFAKYPLEYKRVINADKCPFNRDSKEGIAFAMGHNIQNKCQRLLFKILDENIQRWWNLDGNPKHYYYIYSVRIKKDIEPHPDQYIAVDQDLQVFAGYREGYPFWSINMDDFKYVNNTTHLRTLRNWFPNKQIELMEA